MSHFSPLCGYDGLRIPQWPVNSKLNVRVSQGKPPILAFHVKQAENEIMIIFGVLLGIVILIAMIYMALSKQSNLITRIASLIALAVMIITVIICLFLVLMGNKPPVDESIVLVATPPPAPPKSYNFMVLLLLIIFMVGLFAIVLFLSLREHGKKPNKGK